MLSILAVVLCLLESEENIFSQQDFFFLKAPVFIKRHMPTILFKSTIPESSLSGVSQFMSVSPPLRSSVWRFQIFFATVSAETGSSFLGTEQRMAHLNTDCFMFYHLAPNSSFHFLTWPYLEIHPNENSRETLLPSVWSDCISLILSLHAHPPGGALHIPADSHQAAGRGEPHMDAEPGPTDCASV